MKSVTEQESLPNRKGMLKNNNSARPICPCSIIAHELSLLTLLHSERPKLYAILAFLSAIGLKVNWYSFHKTPNTGKTKISVWPLSVLWCPQNISLYFIILVWIT